MKSKVTEKKLTELRWNYLMHSKRYQDFCDTIRPLAKGRTFITEDMADSIEDIYQRKKDPKERDWLGLSRN